MRPLTIIALGLAAFTVTVISLDQARERKRDQHAANLNTAATYCREVMGKAPNLQACTVQEEHNAIILTARNDYGIIWPQDLLPICHLINRHATRHAGWQHMHEHQWSIHLRQTPRPHTLALCPLPAAP